MIHLSSGLKWNLQGYREAFDLVGFAKAVGVVELILALVTLIHPFPAFLLIVLVWKMGTELFYLHHEVFEWIERGGSYAAVIGLWLCLPPTPLPAPGKGIFRSFSGRHPARNR